MHEFTRISKVGGLYYHGDEAMDELYNHALASYPFGFIPCSIIIFFILINRNGTPQLDCYILSDQIIKIEVDWYINHALVRKISSKCNISQI